MLLKFEVLVARNALASLYLQVECSCCFYTSALTTEWYVDLYMCLEFNVILW